MSGGHRKEKLDRQKSHSSLIPTLRDGKCDLILRIKKWRSKEGKPA